MKILGVDVWGLRKVLGSGEERFCAKVLKSVPAAAEQHNLVKEWKRGVTTLVLGEVGEQLSALEPFSRAPLTSADPALSLAFASVLEGFAQTAVDGGEPDLGVLPGPLFGLISGGPLVRWGGLGRDHLPVHPLLAPIVTRKLDPVVLWTDGERA